MINNWNIDSKLLPGFIRSHLSFTVPVFAQLPSAKSKIKIEFLPFFSIAEFTLNLVGVIRPLRISKRSVAIFLLAR